MQNRKTPRQARGKQKGFTLIELLIVIAIIAIIAGVVFVALNPLERFKDARVSSRRASAVGIASAIKLDQVDNGGDYLTAIDDATAGEVYMIGTCTTGADATAVTDYCTTDPTQTACLDISGLVTEGYLGEIPVSANDEGTWTTAITGYTIEKETSGIIHIRACESEGATEVSVSR